MWHVSNDTHGIKSLLSNTMGCLSNGRHDGNSSLKLMHIYKQEAFDYYISKKRLKN